MQGNKPVTFGGFRLDAANEQLWRGGNTIALRPKAFAVLRHLVGHSGQLVTKQQLLEAVWPGTFVTDAVLKDSIRQVRDALGDDAASPRFIETAHRRGYRFIGRIAEEVTTVVDAPRAPVAPGARAPAHADPPAPLDTSTTIRATGVLGREADLASMGQWLDAALRGERQIVFVTGEPGIGKTTLVNAVRDTAAARGFWIAGGQCLEQYGAGEAFLPVLDALSRCARTPGGERITELLRTHAPTWLLELPSLISAAERDALRRETHGSAREPILRELADAIDAITVDAPLMIVLEDLHWSDYSTLDLITYLARRREPARLIVVGTYRPVDVILGEHPLKAVKRELQAHGLCRELPLNYLTEEAVEEYVALRLPRHQLPKWLVRLVHRRTEGNPLFMVNLVDYLVAERILVEQGDDWQLAGGFADIESGIPENVRHLIEKQIDRLSADERRVLEGASVVGMECSSVAIGAGLEEPTDWVDEHCEALVRRHQFLSPARLVELPDGTITPRYKFSHILYLDVPYRLIPPMRRAQIHRRIGHSGETIYRDRVSEIAAELAMHFEQGKDAPRAVRYLLLAAENARQRSAHHEAETLARRGLSALGGLPVSNERDQHELSLRMVLGGSVMSLKGFAADEVKNIYERAIELCGADGASRHAFSAQWRLLFFYYFRGEIQRCRDIAAQLIERAARLDDPTSTSEAHCALGVVLVDQGDLPAALERFDTVSSVTDRHRDRQPRSFAGPDPSVTSECYTAQATWALGYPDRAMLHMARARDLAQALSHAETQVMAMYFTAHLHQLRGEARSAQMEAESAIALADDYGLSVWVALGRMIRGWARVEQGAVDEGTTEIRRGLSAYQTTGARLWRARSLGVLAQSLVRCGQYEEGLAAIAEAVRVVDETGEHGSAAELYRIEGELRFALASMHERVNLTAADTCLRRALAIAREQHAKSWELRAATSLGWLLIRQHRAIDAVRLITPILGGFTEGHDTTDVKTARTLLEHARGGSAATAGG